MAVTFRSRTDLAAQGRGSSLRAPRVVPPRTDLDTAATSPARSVELNDATSTAREDLPPLSKNSSKKKDKEAGDESSSSSSIRTSRTKDPLVHPGSRIAASIAAEDDDEDTNRDEFSAVRFPRRRAVTPWTTLKSTARGKDFDAKARRNAQVPSSDASVVPAPPQSMTSVGEKGGGVVVLGGTTQFASLALLSWTTRVTFLSINGAANEQTHASRASAIFLEMRSQGTFELLSPEMERSRAAVASHAVSVVFSGRLPPTTDTVAASDAESFALTVPSPRGSRSLFSPSYFQVPSHSASTPSTSIDTFAS
mmetsp:Transcript_33555/g.107215  ORF Transcript_33555/g.107215 Transcript_33555/m.107215 type:complete len:309 (-) Transcript_33555:188-1114(-)